MSIKAKKNTIFEKTTFFNPETDPDPNQKPTFEQKTDPDPDRCQKVNAAGLYSESSVAKVTICCKISCI
jgi:hypothetical protein